MPPRRPVAHTAQGREPVRVSITASTTGTRRRNAGRPSSVVGVPGSGAGGQGLVERCGEGVVGGQEEAGGDGGGRAGTPCAGVGGDPGEVRGEGHALLGHAVHPVGEHGPLTGAHQERGVPLGEGLVDPAHQGAVSAGGDAELVKGAGPVAEAEVTRDVQAFGQRAPDVFRVGAHRGSGPWAGLPHRAGSGRRNGRNRGRGGGGCAYGRSRRGGRNRSVGLRSGGDRRSRGRRGGPSPTHVRRPEAARCPESARREREQRRPGPGREQRRPGAAARRRDRPAS